MVAAPVTLLDATSALIFTLVGVTYDVTHQVCCSAEVNASGVGTSCSTRVIHSPICVSFRGVQKSLGRTEPCTRFRSGCRLGSCVLHVRAAARAARAARAASYTACPSVDPVWLTGAGAQC